jgi:2-polyprenyl-3-methyl-5-hydroxy-6-metoxy-1,4-benzoquinol methylase
MSSHEEAVAACPACGQTARSVLHADLTDRVFFCAPGTWTLYRCHGCDSAYLDPRPAAEAVELAYSRYYTHAAATGRHEKLSTFKQSLLNGYLNSRYGYAFRPASALGPLLMTLLPFHREGADRWVRQLGLPSGGARLLDVGCGDGAFLGRMQAAGWDVQGLDPDPAAVRRGEEAGVPVEHGLLAETTFPESSFDAVTLSHAIEHMPDPIRSLEICYRLLRPRGLLSLTTPNLASAGHSLFGRDWIGLDAPRHFVLFTPDSLARAAERLGFRISSQAPSCRASWTFTASEAISRGVDPVDHPPALPARLRWNARLADLRALREPKVAEEIVLVAAKPETSPPR